MVKQLLHLGVAPDCLRESLATNAVELAFVSGSGDVKPAIAVCVSKVPRVVPLQYGLVATITGSNVISLVLFMLLCRRRPRKRALLPRARLECASLPGDNFRLLLCTFALAGSGCAGLLQ